MKKYFADVKKESFSADGGILIAKLKSQQLPEQGGQRHLCCGVSSIRS
jgi:hypothetical protein